MAVEDLEIILAMDLHRPGACCESDCQPFMAETLRTTVAALSAANIPYAIAGAIAYGVYARAQFTRVLDILTAGDLRDAISNALLGVGFVPAVDAQSAISFLDTPSHVELAVKFALIPPEPEALRDPCSYTIFGVTAPVMKQSYLAWSFCLTRDRPRVIALINEGSLDVRSVRNLMEGAGDSTAMKFLATSEAFAIRERDSSYSKSVAARLANRRPGDQLTPAFKKPDGYS